ncbi:methyl-accepting chemotaxis protein [Sodalinema gerasimenkoae]|uniref:methyl-accepting chemotaxis protein n=1 Tax=Sodalinema gerasimenkoae TaxID=2862348 RepID=UPI001356881E|nr:methyl-accepting chemotaxis protein [Sodalinema gerasimenkoae]
MAQPYSDLSPNMDPDTVSSTHSLDLLDLLLKANQFEQNGEIDRARELYQQIIDQDHDGVWGQSARKALGDSPHGEEPADTQFGEHNPLSTPLTISPVTSSSATPMPPPARPQRRGLSLGLKLKLMAIAAALIPLATAGLASLWFSPGPQDPLGPPLDPPPEDLPLDRQLEEQLESPRLPSSRPSLIIWLLASGSALVTLALILPRFHRWGQQLGAIADYSEAVNQEDPLARLDITPSGNEIGIIAQQIREMIDRLTYQGDRLKQVERQRDRENYQQQQQKQRLQQQAMDLLERLEATRRGDLTGRANLSDGAIGAIADAYNATLAALRRSISQISQVSDRLQEQGQTSHQAAQDLLGDVEHQCHDLDNVRLDVQALSQRLSQLSQSHQDIKTLAQQISQTVAEGSQERSDAVTSIDALRSTVANSSKKAKRLAESAQEVSQILTVVFGISERANLLAFNAAIEAARAGERGAGFRQVADDVRGLAVQIGESTADIEQLINGIQQETAEVLDVLEAGTSNVVNSTRCVQHTQTRLQQVIDLSRTIETALEQGLNTEDPHLDSSETITPVMEAIYSQSLSTLEEAGQVDRHLQQLVQDIEILKSAMAKFQIESS